MTDTNSGGLVVFDHPLIRHKMTRLRNIETDYRQFRSTLAQIAGLMVYEVTRSFETETFVVTTPVADTTGHRVRGSITVVPVLRAGLGMIDGILEVMPEARVGHVGLARDEQTLEPMTYLCKLPADLDSGPVVLVDPMLATGGSASAAVRLLRDAGAKDLRMICLVASPEGIARMRRDHPDVRIYAAALDERLNDKGYIVPGLGDAGDRMYGTT